MGAALARGVQKNVMACVKHFALNSMENARFKVDVRVDDAILHEVYLPHFKRLLTKALPPSCQHTTRSTANGLVKTTLYWLKSCATDGDSMVL
jgi:beta-glucosidase-like glycosyl hydrolase